MELLEQGCFRQLAHVEGDAEGPQVCLHDLGRLRALLDVAGEHDAVAAACAGHAFRRPKVRAAEWIDLRVSEARYAERDGLVGGAAAADQQVQSRERRAIDRVVHGPSDARRAE